MMGDSASVAADRSAVMEADVKSSILKRVSRRISAHESLGSCKGSAFQIKQRSHEELDIEIQSSRILYVLDELITNLEIAATIPTLIENEGKLLFKYLSRNDAIFVMEACRQYTDLEEEDESHSEGVSVFSGSIRGSRALERQNEFRPMESKTDHKTKIQHLERRHVNEARIKQAISVVCASESLRKHLHEIYALDTEEVSWLLIDGAKRLRCAAAQKLAVSANEERERERELRKAWKENNEAKALIDSIQEKLNKQTEELDVQLNAKDELINAYTEKIDILKAKFKEDIKKRILDSEKSMIQKSQISEETQLQLQQESKELVHSYWILLDQHLASEKVLRNKKMKVETQLASWLTKYDQDIGDKQAELEELQRLYDEETNELNELQKKFDEQEEEYVELMTERDEYERRIYEEKAYIYLINRAARIIQRNWRAYRERRKLRRKARKGKKKEKGSANESGADSAKKKSAPDKSAGKGLKDKKGKGKDMLTMGDDPMAKLEAKFKGDILEDINSDPI